MEWYTTSMPFAAVVASPECRAIIDYSDAVIFINSYFDISAIAPWLADAVIHYLEHQMVQPREPVESIYILSGGTASKPPKPECEKRYNLYCLW